MFTGVQMDMPILTIRGLEVKFPIVQGGMGIGYANHMLSGTVSGAGGLGAVG